MDTVSPVVSSETRATHGVAAPAAGAAPTTGGTGGAAEPPSSSPAAYATQEAAWLAARRLRIRSAMLSLVPALVAWEIDPENEPIYLGGGKLLISAPESAFTMR